MKKIILCFLASFMFISVSFANCSQNFNETSKKPACKCNNEKQNEINKCESKKQCDVCPVEDDEYCVYNQCYFDRQFRSMKKKLCLSQKQENMIDNLYLCYKADMEALCNKYKNQKNKVLNMIEYHNQCWKDERKILKDICLEAKERCIDFRDDVKEVLCKSQYKDFNKFQREQKKKMKRIIKYGAIYKFPCESCQSGNK